MRLTRSETTCSALARGRHLVDAVAGCSTSDCHGADLAGGRRVDFGPLGFASGPNITMGNLGATYSDGELARLIRHGIKKDGRSVLFMPVQDFGWLPDEDVAAIVSYLRSAPAVDRESAGSKVAALGKVLDRRGLIVFDVARRIDHDHFEPPPAPAPNVDYGRFLVRGCTGCHGGHLSGGPIPGAPASFATPSNLTPDASGLGTWAYDDFDRALTTGVSKDGKKLDPFMPYEAYGKLDDLEKHALWSYLRSVAPRPFGER
jgi:hypothetical protein